MSVSSFIIGSKKEGKLHQSSLLTFWLAVWLVGCFFLLISSLGMKSGNRNFLINLILIHFSYHCDLIVFEIMSCEHKIVMIPNLVMTAPFE